jgi:hypothetical protein
MKHEIDGAVNNERFSDDFWVDLIVTPAIDSEGHALQSDTPGEFWTTVARRKVPTIVPNFSFFCDDSDMESNNKSNRVKAINDTSGSVPRRTVPVAFPVSEQTNQESAGNASTQPHTGTHGLAGATSLEDLEDYLRDLSDHAHDPNPLGELSTAVDSDSESDLLAELNSLQLDTDGIDDIGSDGEDPGLNELDMEAALAELAEESPTQTAEVGETEGLEFSLTDLQEELGIHGSTMSPKVGDDGLP